MARSLRRIATLTTILASAAIAACTPSSPSIRTITGVAQGTTYSLQWTGDTTTAVIEAAAEQELERIDALLSNYRPDSTLERFNAARHTEPIELPAELVALFVVAKKVHAASAGCFDPTVRPLVRAWGFDGESPAVPSTDAIEAARAAVGLDQLELIDATHVRKRSGELELDMASIGQGYTVGRLAEVLERHGNTAYLAEIGGEVVTRGSKPGATPWRIGIENPTNAVTPSAAVRALRMPGERTAAITSGSYRQFLEADGRRFSHIIDPRSGWPVEHELLSVTVVGSDATVAAAWGTALLCLGPEAALAAADREHLAALLWIAAGDRSARLELSRLFAEGWNDLIQESVAR